MYILIKINLGYETVQIDSAENLFNEFYHFSSVAPAELHEWSPAYIHLTQVVNVSCL
jgi:hypothetical protein